MGKRTFSAAWLKYFACVAMLADHIGAILISPDSALYLPLRCFGRMAFPLFAFFVAQGCRKTHDLPGYLRRLFLFALVAQGPYMLAFGYFSGSVILTFFLAGAGIALYEAAREHVWAPLAVFPVLCMALMAYWTDSDYGPLAVLLIFAIYLCGDNRAAWAICMTVALYLFYANPFFLFASVSTVMLLFYHGELGRGSKWFFYWFYPVHLLILAIVGYLL